MPENACTWIGKVRLLTAARKGGGFMQIMVPVPKCSSNEKEMGGRRTYQTRWLKLAGERSPPVCRRSGEEDETAGAACFATARCEG